MVREARFLPPASVAADLIWTEALPEDPSDDDLFHTDSIDRLFRGLADGDWFDEMDS
jgi:hypothetical protein